MAAKDRDPGVPDCAAELEEALAAMTEEQLRGTMRAALIDRDLVLKTPLDAKRSEGTDFELTPITQLFYGPNAQSAQRSFDEFFTLEVNYFKRNNWHTYCGCNNPNQCSTNRFGSSIIGFEFVPPSGTPPNDTTPIGLITEVFNYDVDYWQNDNRMLDRCIDQPDGQQYPNGRRYRIIFAGLNGRDRDRSYALEINNAVKDGNQSTYDLGAILHIRGYNSFAPEPRVAIGWTFDIRWGDQGRRWLHCGYVWTFIIRWNGQRWW